LPEVPAGYDCFLVIIIIIIIIQASPGNLAQFEDLLFGSAETTSSSGIIAVRLTSDQSQLVSAAAAVVNHAMFCFSVSL